MNDGNKTDSVKMAKKSVKTKRQKSGTGVEIDLDAIDFDEVEKVIKAVRPRKEASPLTQALNRLMPTLVDAHENRKVPIPQLVLVLATQGIAIKPHTLSRAIKAGKGNALKTDAKPELEA